MRREERTQMYIRLGATIRTQARQSGLAEGKKAVPNRFERGIQQSEASQGLRQRGKRPYLSTAANQTRKLKDK
jgi:hypothetical protein